MVNVATKQWNQFNSSQFQALRQFFHAAVGSMQQRTALLATQVQGLDRDCQTLLQFFNPINTCTGIAEEPLEYKTFKQGDRYQKLTKFMSTNPLRKDQSLASYLHLLKDTKADVGSNIYGRIQTFLESNHFTDASPETLAKDLRFNQRGQECKIHTGEQTEAYRGKSFGNDSIFSLVALLENAVDENNQPANLKPIFIL